MGLTQKLGTIPLAIQTDSSNNVGIGTSTIGGKLDVRAAATSAFSYYFRNAAGGYGGGVYNTGSNNTQLYLATSAGTENILLNSSGASYFNGGNVGIGTSSPSKLFTVLNSSEGQTAGISGPTYGIRFDNGGAFAFGASAIHGVDTTLTGSYQSLAINGSQLLFGTDGGEKMRLTNGGNFLIGQTTASASTNGMYLRPGVDSGMVATNDSALSLVRLSSNGKILRFFFGASEVGSISTNTNSLPSDLNFKKDITNITIGLNLINKLRPVHYRHKMDNEDEPLSNGIIAQELEEALLECGVEKNTLLMLQHKPTEDKNQSEYWVDYIKIIPILINSIQELSAKVTALENK